MTSTCLHCSRPFFTTSKLALYCTFSCKRKAERFRRLDRDKTARVIEGAAAPLVMLDNKPREPQVDTGLEALRDAGVSIEGEGEQPKAPKSNDPKDWV